MCLHNGGRTGEGTVLQEEVCPGPGLTYKLHLTLVKGIQLSVPRYSPVK